MSERVSSYTPMPEANTPRIRTTVTLPFHLENEIGLNTKYIHTLLQIGGLRNVKITSDSEGKTSNAVPQTIGFNENGEAYAGKIKSNLVPTSTHQLEQDNSRATSKHNLWPSLTTCLNTEEMKQRILLSNRVVTDPQNWANEINLAIKKAILINSTKNLIATSPAILDGIWLAWSIVNTSINIMKAPQYLPFAIGWASFCRIAGSSAFKNIERFQKGEGYRLSLFPVLEIDRAIILQAYSKIKPVAKTLK